MADDLFKQSTSKFLHGVRGLVVLDGDVEGAVQNVVARESADPDVARVMGSRYIQGKELKDKVVTGTIETLLFDPESQLIMQLSEPVDGADDATVPDRDDLATPKTWESTQVPDLISGGVRNASRSADLSLMPVFDIECKAKVLTDDGDFAYFGFVIKRAMITDYEVRMNMNTFWLANVEFIADKIVRENSFV